MIPPIFSTVDVSPVRALLKDGKDELRFYSFGRAPQNVKKPYAVWRQVYGQPENYLSNIPDMDLYGTQIDIYADPTPQGAKQARQIAEALRNAIEPVAHITAWRGESRDPDTNNYVFSFDVDWHTSR